MKWTLVPILQALSFSINWLREMFNCSRFKRNIYRCQMHCRGAGIDSNSVLGSHGSGKFGFKLAGFGAGGDPAALQSFFDLVQLAVVNIGQGEGRNVERIIASSIIGEAGKTPLFQQGDGPNKFGWLEFLAS